MYQPLGLVCCKFEVCQSVYHACVSAGQFPVPVTWPEFMLGTRSSLERLGKGLVRHLRRTIPSLNLARDISEGAAASSTRAGRDTLDFVLQCFIALRVLTRLCKTVYSTSVLRNIT